MWDSIVGECGQCCGDWCPIRVVAIVKEGSWDRAAFVVKMRKTDHDHYIYILCQSYLKILMKNPERAQSIVENWEVKQGVEEGEPLEQCHRSYLLLPVFYHLSTQRYFGLRQICCGKKKLFKVNFQSLSTTFTFKIIFAFRIVLVGDASTYPIH